MCWHEDPSCFLGTLFSHILSTGGKYRDVPIPHLFCILYMSSVCSLNHSHDLKAPIKWNSLLTSISTSLIRRCKINVKQCEQNHNYTRICDCKPQLQPRCFPSSRYSFNFLQDLAPRISAGNSLLSYPQNRIHCFLRNQFLHSFSKQTCTECQMCSGFVLSEPTLQKYRTVRKQIHKTKTIMLWLVQDYYWRSIWDILYDSLWLSSFICKMNTIGSPHNINVRINSIYI